MDPGSEEKKITDNNNNNVNHNGNNNVNKQGINTKKSVHFIQSPPIKHMMHNGHNIHHNGNNKYTPNRSNGIYQHNNINNLHQQQHHLKNCNVKNNANPPQKKIRKFVRCSKKVHQSLRTTTSCGKNGDKLNIEILCGGLSSTELLYIKQHKQYQVRYNDEKQQILLATIPKHYSMAFNFKSIASFTAFIVNNQFIRFRNRGPTQTKHVSLWRMYKFEGEQTLFNIWIVQKAAQKSINLINKKNKNYHSSSWSPTSSSTSHDITELNDDLLKHIFSFVNGPKYHCWIHIHEIIDRSHHRSNLLGLEYNSNNRNVDVMQRSPTLLKKIRQIGDRFYTKKVGVNSVLTDKFFKKSVEMFKAVY